jgi:hypothetical protein
VAQEYDGRQTFSQYKCEQVLIGKTKVEKGKCRQKRLTNEVCIASRLTKTEKRMPKNLLLPTVEHQNDHVEPVSAIVTLFAARRWWVGGGKIT